MTDFLQIVYNFFGMKECEFFTTQRKVELYVTGTSTSMWWIKFHFGGLGALK